MDISEIDPWVDPAPSNANTMKLKKLRQFIKKKKPWAYRFLAQRYAVGEPGLKQSDKRALENFQKGMKLGDPVCMNEMGRYNESGSKVDKSPKLAKKAFEHYQKAALKGYACAQYNLGICYSNGVGVEKSNSKAREWYNRATAQYNEQAIENLRLLDLLEEKAKAKEEKKKSGEKKAKKEEQNKTQVPKESESSTSTNFDDNQEIEIKDTKDLEIVPWIDDAPKNVTTMTLNRLRQKVKKKKVWAIQELGTRYKYGRGGAEISLDKAIDNYKKGVILGFPRSMNVMGYMYDNGEGVSQNHKLAFEHYQMGAFKGFDVAQYNLGECYHYGRYVKQSNTKAREWYNRAANQGDKDAAKKLKLLDEAESVPKEKKAATEEKAEAKESQPQIMQEEPIKSEKLSASTSPTSKNIIGNNEIKTEDTKDLQIVPWIDDAPKNVKTMTLNRLRQKVKKKNGWAINELGRRYEHGNGGVEESLDKAIDCFKKGVKLGSPKSMTSLGYMYERGKGVDNNTKLTFELYQTAAFKGFDAAQCIVGACYCNLDYINVEQSIIKAREWLNRAAAQKNESAITLLKQLDEAEEKIAEEDRQAHAIQEKEVEEKEVEEKEEETKEEKEEATMPTTTVTKKKHRLYCLNCSRPYTNQTKHMFRRCSMCCGRDAIFCGPLCQELTWPDHREECIRIGIILHNY